MASRLSRVRVVDSRALPMTLSRLHMYMLVRLSSFMGTDSVAFRQALVLCRTSVCTCLLSCRSCVRSEAVEIRCLRYFCPL